MTLPSGAGGNCVATGLCCVWPCPHKLNVSVLCCAYCTPSPMSSATHCTTSTPRTGHASSTRCVNECTHAFGALFLHFVGRGGGAGGRRGRGRGGKGRFTHFLGLGFESCLPSSVLQRPRPPCPWALPRSLPPPLACADHRLHQRRVCVGCKYVRPHCVGLTMRLRRLFCSPST